VFQEITLAADFINIYHSNKSDYLRALEYLEKEKTIFVDNYFYSDLDQFLDTVPDEEKSLAKGNIQLFLSGKIKSMNPNTSPFTPKEIPDDRFRTALSIAAMNGDRILIRHNYNGECRVTIGVKTNVNVCALREYLNPNKSCKCANPRRVELKDKEQFDPSCLVEPYIRVTEELWIQDPWPITYNAKKDKFVPRPFLRDLMKMCKKGSEIIIHSLSDESRRDTDRVCEEGIKSQIKMICPANLSLNFTFGKVHDRTFRTEQFNIDVGGGIGMFFKNFEKNIYENGAGDNSYITITLRHT